MISISHRALEGRSRGYYGLLAVLAVLVMVGLWAAHYMESNGHYVTGMNNQIVWGVPHVFAVFLIVAASGALNVASVASVFDRPLYKPMARLSGLLAVALLIGGLAVLVLDLGRPDRLIVAMTHYNFKSIFAWNIFLYTGFVAIVIVYLWMQMERRMNGFVKPAGYLAFVWRLVLTTGTGSIFGFLVARQAYDAALMGPLFVTMSFSFGSAAFILLLLSLWRWAGCPLGHEVMERLRRLQGMFVIVVLYMVVVFHLSKLYITREHGFESFILLDGGAITLIFWLGQIVIGSLIPLAILYSPFTRHSRPWTAVCAALIVVGGLAQIYVIIIAAQAYPLEIFPGKIVVESSFFDGAIVGYQPSMPEVMLGVGGVALALLMVMLAMKVLPFVPETLADTPDSPGAESLHAPPTTEPAA
jgi:molybdopterin-containing oxidoreductase family membrane subunit